MITISIIDDNLDEFEPWWKNFDNYYDPLWLSSAAQRWVDYVRELLLKDNIDYRHPYLQFETEEDMINFILKWS